MSRLAEQQQGSTSPIRQGLWINSRRWGRSEEASSKLDLWAALANPVALRKSVARDFASAISDNLAVTQVWITDLHDDLHVAVALTEPESETDIREVFIELVCTRLDPAEGELFVFPADEVPEWVQLGITC